MRKMFTMEEEERIAKALAYATTALNGQRRLNKSRELKINHAIEVATLVRDAGGSAIEVSAGYLHDVVEDTSRTLADIVHGFGQEIGNIVDGLTDPPSFIGLPTFERKKKQAERIRDKSRSVKMVKIGDQDSNLRSVAEDPPEGWSTRKCLEYIEGAGLIVDSCMGACHDLEFQFFESYRKAFSKYGLYHGMTHLGVLCGFTDAEPSKWPLGHKPVLAGQTSLMNCPECKKIALTVQF
ncbi:MAG: bifunctional (p)ppGpp synthetase/guanosine-3,5-bis(diphosphate) 3-pyrophosphohydrolase [Parcubacteria group bacterium]|nr:bifunctional (p)ppGpp synthetase/guanosine-3,5-bis(diphosphate) 3-pyrophosphohydrolase [Parcubacteria group bacterium]